MSHAFKQALFIHFKPTEKKEKRSKFLFICQSLNKMEFALWLPMPNKTTVNSGYCDCNVTRTWKHCHTLKM